MWLTRKFKFRYVAHILFLLDSAALHELSHLTLTKILQARRYYLHFTDEDTENQKEQEMCLRSPS